MNTINQRLLVLGLLVLAPVLASAHPGHDHSGNLWQDVVHFMFTQYLYVVAVMAVLFFVVKRAYKLKSR